MTAQNSSARERLFILLDKIIGEERGFKADSKNYTPKGSSLISRFLWRNFTKRNRQEKYRQVHEELHRVHRQFTSEHELMIQRCHGIARQARAGLLTETEMALELERLQCDLKRLKAEHQHAESESERLLESLGQRHGRPGRTG